ncbi:CHAT domain-containing protein [Nodosilinea sp. AN01ver1]|uniref:CHAT domain-containing protein n=1 Tax=Nodosilinea sp. AN01ver1 TaxID=3423362 RepID=UPI003D314731
MIENQRMQACVDLIEQLLRCPQGEEAALLQANAELVDAGLVAVMGQYADWLKSQENSNALWLRQFAAQLAQALGFEESSPSSATAGDVIGFAVEMMQLIAQTKGDRAQVYEFFRANVRRLDETLLRALPSLFEILIQETDQFKVVVAFYDFGNLIQQFSHGNRMLNLELSIVAYEQVQIHARDTFPEIWAATQDNLALAYMNRIQGSKSQNIEKAIIALKRALDIKVRFTSPEEQALTQLNLSNAYFHRLEGNHADNLEQSIIFCEQSLKVFTYKVFPVLWIGAQRNLAIAYVNRKRGVKTQNIEQAIDIFHQVLRVIDHLDPTQKWDWAATKNSLGNAYVQRIQGSRAENIEQAIILYDQALSVRTFDAFPQDWAMTQNGLGCAYNRRIKGDRAENIEQSLLCYQKALEVYCKTSRYDQALTQNNLAFAYWQRLRGSRSDNLEKAIEAYDQVLQILSEQGNYNSEKWAITQQNLSNAYSERLQGNRGDNLEKAIEACQEALKIYNCQDYPENWATTQNSLANAYMYRLKGDYKSNLERAVLAYREALKVYTNTDFPEDWAMVQNNLAFAYWQQSKGHLSDKLELAIAAYRQALEVYTFNTFPNECRRTARYLGNLYFDQQNWLQSAKASCRAIRAAEVLYQSCILPDSKVSELTIADGLMSHCAYALARIKHLKAAVLVLEQHRARGFSEALDRDRTNLDSLRDQNETLYTQYKNITQQLRNLEDLQRDRMVSADRHIITPEDLRNEATRLRAELTITLGQIRKQPGYETFLTLPTFADVQKASTPDSPLTYLLTTPAGSLALVVTPDDIHPIWFNDFTKTQLTELLKTWFATYSNARNDRQTWLNTIDQTTHQLWEPLIEQMAQQIKELGFDRIILIPTGYLSLLPLHAAWTEDNSKPGGRRYAIDNIHITYAPNAKSLTAVREIVACTSNDSILAINNPTQDLDNTEIEVQSVIAHFSNPTVLNRGEATIDQVRSQLPEAAIIHFSCHGTANLNEPLASGLLMSDGLLTLKDIFALNLTKGDRGIRLAILSACETGMIGTKNTDEAISLPTGLLQAGVAAVIASLWSVSDLSTMLLLTRFYDLWRNAELEPPIALTQAQQWVRDTTNQQKYDYLKSHFQALVSQGHMSEQEVNLLLSEFMIHYIYEDGPNSRSFAHPFHWAAFSYTGV